MNQIEQIVLKSVNASAIIHSELIQELWSGYGEIRKYILKGGTVDSVIVKHVKLPEEANHPRGWNTDISHQRKLKSYQIELNWYTHFANSCPKEARVPTLYYAAKESHEMLMIMEDLDSSGFPLRKTSVTLNDVKACIKWLAHFHAKFMGLETDELWSIGTYWHLDTRPDELDQMKNSHLKKAATQIDQKLNEAKYLTIVHGDAKLANFCFSNESNVVAAVDFQYVGKGCGMKDLAYLLSSCLDEDDCQVHESGLLNFYFSELKKGIIDIQIDFDALEQEWRELYKYAWADFYRFLDGWSPGHWKMHDYSKELTENVIKELNK